MPKRFVGFFAALALSTTAGAGIREDWQAVADAVASTGNITAAMQIEDAINAVPDDELERIYGGVDVTQLIEDFTASGNALRALDEATGRTPSTRAIVAASAGFPDAVYPTTPLCNGSTRSDSNVGAAALLGIQTARIALDSAKVIWSGLSRACDETLVVLGEGGNTSLACIPADIALFAAELGVGVAEDAFGVISFCDGAVDAAEIEGSYDRLEHLHTDIVTLTDLVHVMMSRQLETMRLLVTSDWQKTINPAVLSCSGEADCPTRAQIMTCESGGTWPCQYGAPLFFVAPKK
jgi:hypothetical protein